MPRAPEFFRSLNEQTLEALEDRARQPGTTGDELLAWLAEIGVSTSRSAVYRWLQDFRLEDRTRRASDVARQYLAVAKDSDPTAISAASLAKFEEAVFSSLVNGEELTPDDLAKLSTAMRGAQVVRRELEAARTRFDEASKTLRSRREITDADIAAVRKAVFG